MAKKLHSNNEKYAEDMFLLGVMHDLGYEFVENNISHAAIGGEILNRSGYKYWKEVSLHGDETLDNIISLIQKNTRNYAKRQYTYFRNQLPVNWFNSKEEAYNFMEKMEDNAYGIMAN